MATVTDQVGQLIKASRRDKGLTQKELGELLGVSESAVTRYEGGTQNLTLLTLQKISNVLGTKMIISIIPE